MAKTLDRNLSLKVAACKSYYFMSFVSTAIAIHQLLVSEMRVENIHLAGQSQVC